MHATGVGVNPVRGSAEDPSLNGLEEINVPRSRGHRGVGAAKESGGGGSIPRVVLMGDQLLTCQAMQTALASRGVHVMQCPVPHGPHEIKTLALQAEAFAGQVGVVVQERFDPIFTGECERMLERVPDLHWMLLTSCEPGAHWQAFLDAGAEAVLPLRIGLDRLIGALPSLATGGQVMEAEDRVALAHRDRVGGQALADLTHLSPREVEVLVHLAHGRTLGEYTRIHGVTEDTVRSQIQAILRKLHVSSQLTAVAIWIRASQSWPEFHGA